MSEIKRLARNYEISVWTLQDSFITVLGSLNGKYRGRIQNPEMKLVNDGTQEFDFSIPMYLDDGIDRIINPVWQDINNAQVIMGMRKIKVIFNKATDYEKVFEFIITKVTKVHENDKPQCDVHCEGLAFHELGKIGYKIEFSTDELSEESYQWYKDKTGEEPVPTIDYWCQKKLQLEKLPSNASLIDSKKWYYKVDMDWSDYAHASDIPRANDKIYEEEFAVAWTDNLLPKNSSSVTSYKEKTRILDEKESNIYNLTQKLAETFGVFCRYDYEYDDNYHIISRTVVFYNNGIKDGARKLSFTYPYSSTRISREDDCIDIVTKMYVSAIEDQTTDSGLISIMSSDANPTKEDYLMNFDYLHEIGTITDEQYNYITTYERNIAAINTSLAQIQNQLLVKEDRLPKVEALHTTAVNAAALDSERMNNAKRLCDELTNRTGVIVVSGANAKPAILQNQIQDGSLLFFNAPDNGILSETLQIYTTFNGGTLSGALNKNVGSKVYDEFGNLTKVENISVSVLNGSSRRQIYLTYSYHPKLYWEKIQKVWASRLAKDEAEAATYQSEITTLESEIEALKTQRTTLLNNKAAEIKKFEELMGPALREGYWTPDNYNVNTGEKYTDYITISATNLTTAGGESGHTLFLWDKEMFDDEQKGTYQIGVNQSEKSYPCIILNSSQIAFMADPNNADKPIGVLYYDYTASAAVAHEPSNMQCLALGAGAKLTIVYSSSNGAQLALLLTGASSFDDDKINFIKSNAAEARIGYLTTETVSGTLRVVDKPSTPLTISNNQWVSLSSSLYVVYPRCKIDSLTLKNNETDLNVSYNNNLLTEFEDYYVFQRVDNDNSTITSNYYITLKPEVFLTSGALNLQLAVRFCLSNSSTSIYLDAREVLKENSKPKVTYSVDPNVFYEEFIYTDYNALNVIAFINDYQLQFDGAQGYISSLNLNLDFPNQDTIEIKNYKNKFEDLFSTIVAQTEAMEKNESVLTAASKAFNTDGSLTTSLLTGALKKVDLNYAFNNGKLTISEKDGIWGISDSGVVAYRGGGIFTATRKDEAGNWIWNTGIVPEGINADLITSGQLDTARIKVYAGDRLRFQLNGDGLFAYKSFYSDYEAGAAGTALTRLNTLTSNSDTGIDYSQYVVLSEDGLFLVAKKGAYVLNEAKNDHIVVLNNNTTYSEVQRVSIDWEGFTLRNWNNEKVFYANANTGDLTLKGTLYASGLYIVKNNTTKEIDNYLDTHTYTDANGISKTVGDFHVEFTGYKEDTDGHLEDLDGYVDVLQIQTTYLDQSSGQIELGAFTTNVEQGIVTAGGSVSLDANGKIMLSSVAFDSNGIGDTSSIKITPTAITVGSSGSISIAAGKLQMSAVDGLGDAIDDLDDAISHAADDAYKQVNGITISTSGVDVIGKRVYLGTEVYSNKDAGNYVEIGSNEINIKATNGAFRINDEPVWARNDIIYAPTPEAVRLQNPPNDRQWLWVQPIGFNTVIFEDDGGSLKSQDGAVLNSSDNMQYKVTMECYFTGLNAGLGNDITLSISNSDNNVSWNMRWYGVQFEAGAGRTGSRTLTDTWNTINIQENLCSVASISWSADAPGASYTLHVSSVVLEAKSATGTGAWSECKVYYFPAGTYPYDPTATA